jgi:hypothetical protein
VLDAHRVHTGGEGSRSVVLIQARIAGMNAEIMNGT